MQRWKHFLNLQTFLLLNLLITNCLRLYLGIRIPVRFSTDFG